MRRAIQNQTPVFLLLFLAASAAAPLASDNPAAIPGIVEDPSGQPVAGAAVTLLSPAGTPTAVVLTNADGRFLFPAVLPGAYQVEVRAPFFSDYRGGLMVFKDLQALPHRVRLTLRGTSTEVTVTASPGAVEELSESPRQGTSLGREVLQERGSPTLAHALAGAPGLHLQQTASGQSSPFLRGMTGYHVVHLIDGVRFNNATFRFGPNQYFAFVDSSQAQTVEMTLGPSSSEYGSDSLGGTIQVLAPSAPFAADRRSRTSGRIALSGETADLSTGLSGAFSIGNDRLAALLGVSGRHHNNLRTGRGVDSRHVLRRLFDLQPGLIQGLTGERLPETAFSQQAGHLRLEWRVSRAHSLRAWYQQTDKRGVRAYKDLWGGLGRQQALFRPQALRFFYLRHSYSAIGMIEEITSTFSLNSQHDGFVGQGLRQSDAVRADRSNDAARGYAVQARLKPRLRSRLLAGADLYDEALSGNRYPLTAGRNYRTGAVYAQAFLENSNRKVRAAAGTRHTQVRFGGRSFGDTTYNASLTFRPAAPLAVHGLISRGFRAPNVNDLATVGLQDLGFEFPAEAVAQLGGWTGSSSGEGALPTGKPIRDLGSEKLFNYEAGVVWSDPATLLRFQVFLAELYDAIARRTVLFRADSVPTFIAGIAVRALAPTPDQAAGGFVPVATDLDPRAAKAFVNVGRQRYAGTVFEFRHSFSPGVQFHGAYHWLYGRELDPSAPLRRLPPQQGRVALLWFPKARIWLELCLEAAGPQERLSPGDLSDERIGAERSRSDIAAFFGSARLRPYLAGGVFLPTGETLSQIKDRVLPRSLAAADTTRLALFTRTPGYAVPGLKGGVRLTESQSLGFALLNLNDRNYRQHGSGLDAPGRSLSLRWELQF